MPPPTPARVRWLVVLLLSVMATVEVASLRHLTVTYDEPWHFLYGHHLLQLNSNRFDDSKMPVSALNALPAALIAPLPAEPSLDELKRGVEAGRWVTVSFASAGEVWAVTDDAGGVRLSGPASGPVQLRVPDALLRAE